eukprot:NODE_827_length_3873_cov_0.542925.p3 type:complete len:156 gc:universal NODE_827_length_3873_cov_0.542925:120-587(+)
MSHFQNYEQFVNLLVSVHKDLGKIDFTELEKLSMDMIFERFHSEISQIHFIASDIPSNLRKLNEFGYGIDKKVKENKHIVFLTAHLMELERMNDVDVMEPIDYIPPSDYNVLLIDVKHNDLVGRIADQLDVKYLETVHNPVFKQSVSGILFGSNA